MPVILWSYIWYIDLYMYNYFGNSPGNNLKWYLTLHFGPRRDPVAFPVRKTCRYNIGTGNIGILALFLNISISVIGKLHKIQSRKYRQYWHIGKGQISAIGISAKIQYRHVLILCPLKNLLEKDPTKCILCWVSLSWKSRGMSGILKFSRISGKVMEFKLKLTKVMEKSWNFEIRTKSHGIWPIAPTFYQLAPLRVDLLIQRCLHVYHLFLYATCCIWLATS